MAVQLLMWIKKDANYFDVQGESQLEIDTTDKFLDPLNADRFIEIVDFRFGVSLIDSSLSSQQTTNAQGQEIQYDGKFEKFIKGTEVSRNSETNLYPLSFDEVSLDRVVDNASPVLMKTCFDTSPLKAVSIVKFKGSDTSTGSRYVPYVRLDFEDVLITDLSWSISDGKIKEDMKFVYRAVTMKYRPQNNDGTPGAVAPAGPLSLVKTVGGKTPGG
jgi:type VI protein secretion system component Hcp